MSRNLAIQERERAEDQNSSRSDERQAHPARHVRHTRGTKVLWTVCALATLAGICSLGGAFVSPSAGEETGSLLVAGFWIVVGMICGIVAWHRPAQVVISADHFGGNRSARASVGRTGEHVLSGRGCRSPRLHAVVLTVAFAGSVAILVVAVGASEKSAYTQSHGISVVATVDSIDNYMSCHNEVCTTSFRADVTLRTPVKGHAGTAVWGQNSFPGVDGEQLPVLVDPHDPAYAELAGNEHTPRSSVLVLAIVAGVLGCFMLTADLRLVHRYPGLLPSRHRAAV